MNGRYYRPEPYDKLAVELKRGRINNYLQTYKKTTFSNGKNELIELASVVEHIKMYYSLSYLQDTFMKILKQLNILRMETYHFLKLTFAK